MSSVSDDVLEEIEKDVFLQEPLARQIVNAIGLARWLIEHRGLEGTEETIADAIRDFQKAAEPSEMEAARATLRTAAHETLSERCVLHLRKDPVVLERVRRLQGEFEVAEGEAFRMVACTDKVSLVLERAQLEGTLEVIGDEAVKGVHDDLFEVRVYKRDEAIGTGVLGLVLQALRIGGAEAVFAHSGFGEQFVYIQEEDRGKVLPILAELFSE